MFNSSRFGTRRFVKVESKWKYGDILIPTKLTEIESKINDIETGIKSATFGSDRPDFTLWNIIYRFKTQLAAIKGDSLTQWHIAPVASLGQFKDYAPKLADLPSVLLAYHSHYEDVPRLVNESVYEISFNASFDDIAYYAPLNCYYLTTGASGAPYSFYRATSSGVEPITALRYFYGIKILVHNYKVYVITDRGSICVTDPRSDPNFQNASYFNPPSPSSGFQTRYENIIFDGQYIYVLPRYARFDRTQTYRTIDYCVFDTQNLTYSWVEPGYLFDTYQAVVSGFLGFDGYLYFRNNLFSPRIQIFKCKGYSYSVFTLTESVDTENYGWMIQLPSGNIIVPAGLSAVKMYRIVGNSLIEVASKDGIALNADSCRRLCNCIAVKTRLISDVRFYSPRHMEKLEFVSQSQINYPYRTVGQLNRDTIYAVGYTQNKVLYFTANVRGWL